MNPDNTITLGLERGGETVAILVVFPGLVTVVRWPTSVIVYPSLEAAYAVHVEHMGGRGEASSLKAAGPMGEWVSKGWIERYQDRCEGIPDHAFDGGRFVMPSWMSEEPASHQEGYRLGYTVGSLVAWGRNSSAWREDETS